MTGGPRSGTAPSPFGSRSCAPGADARLVAALRDGDEGVFADLVQRYHPSLVRVATSYVGSRAVAEEVAQDAWLGVIRGVDRFEGRSSFKTWLFRILINRAKTRAVLEGRSLPTPALEAAEAHTQPSVDPDRFHPPDTPWAGHWSSPPCRWDELPEQRLAAKETAGAVAAAIDALPPVQRQVIALRDIDGWSAPEVCDMLELSATNQRVLLHRARSTVRARIEQHLAS